jgi:hydrogenase maturation protease
MTDTKTRILVLGVGNILFTDEGIGVRAVEELTRLYDFSDNVTLMDGGTLGTRLMDPIMDSDLLIVVDAVLGDGPAGSVYRLVGEDLRKSLAFKDSMHQTDLVDTLVMCDIVGNRPEAVIVGMEPEDFHTMALELSPWPRSARRPSWALCWRKSKRPAAPTPRRRTPPRQDGPTARPTRSNVMCLAVPAEVISIEDQVATCRVGEGDTTVTASLMILDDTIAPGDFLIIHAGFAIRKLDPVEARETLQILRDVIAAAEEAGIKQDNLVI